MTIDSTQRRIRTFASLVVVCISVIATAIHSDSWVGVPVAFVAGVGAALWLRGLAFAAAQLALLELGEKLEHQKGWR